MEFWGPTSRSFLAIPTCPIPLLGRDLLAKVETSILFPHPLDPRLARCSPFLQTPQSHTLLLLSTSQVDPQVWDTSKPLSSQTLPTSHHYCERSVKWKEIPLSLYSSFLFLHYKPSFSLSVITSACKRPVFKGTTDGSMRMLRSGSWKLYLVGGESKGVDQLQHAHSWHTILPGWCISQLLPEESSVGV